VALAEGLNAKVLTDQKTAAAFPARHPLHPLAPVFFMSDEGRALIAGADVVLSLDWLDLGGTLAQAFASGPVTAKVIQASLDERLANGWSYDHQAAADVDVDLGTTPAQAVAALVQRLGFGRPAPLPPPEPVAPPGPGPIDLVALARALMHATQGREVSYLRLPLGWPGRYFPVAHPLDYLGYDGGAGLGSGPGMAIGSALALRGSGRLPVAVLGDGDFLMGAQALWSAAHYEIPLLVVLANNRSYYNDEMHQERVARARGRPVENRWIGQRMDSPPVDMGALARSLGCEAPERVERAERLAPALSAALARVAAGAAVVLDVAIDPGYASEM
jgi:thiamine pyrophosphate-dependent acetolactate synthase large subunit-like protein